MERCRSEIAAVLLCLSVLLCAFTRLPVFAAAESTEAAPAPILEDSWFDDAVFIGDSIAGTLQAYAEQHSQFGTALFFCRTNYSITSAVNGSMLLYYRGGGYKPNALLPQTGAKKVFFLLGMNDVGSYDDTRYASLWSALVDGIRENAPEIRIFFQSVTPMVKSLPNSALTNARIDRYNELLRDFCEEYDCCYVDVASSFKDDDGTLRGELCRDGYVHLILDAGALWCDALKNPANYSRDLYGDWAAQEDGRGVDMQAFYNGLAVEAELEDMVTLSSSTVYNAYGIAPEDYTQGIAALCGDSVRVDEIWLFEAADEEAAVRILAAAQARIEARREEMEDYLPDQYEITRHAVAVREGRYTALFIAASSGKMAQDFRQAVQ